MNAVFEIFYNIILPIFVVVGVVLIADRSLHLDSQALSQAVIYIFTPFLVFDGMAKLEVDGGEAGLLAAVALLSCVLMTFVAWGVARAARFDRRLTSAFLLSAVVINAGNYGLPLNQFAFGASGEQRALIFFVVTVAFTSTVGVFLASLGEASARDALVNALKVPLLYAVLAGVLVNALNVTIPVPIDRASVLLGQAAIPSMLVVLGLQLSNVKPDRRIWPMLCASALRLLVSPLIVLGLVVLVGMDGLARDVSIVQAGMPTAVIGGVLATEFRSDSEFVTGVILLSTLLSIVTLSIILTILL